MGLQHRETSRRGSGPIIFIGVLTLLLAAVGAWLTFGPSDEPEISVAAGDGELQPASDASIAQPPADTDPTYLVLAPAPADYQAFIIDRGTAVDMGTFDIWGRVGAEDFFVDGDLAVVRLTGNEMEGLDDFGSDPTLEIAGRTVQPLDEDEDGIGGVAWLEDDQTTAIVIASLSFDQETIIEIATGLLTTGQVDPHGLDLLAEGAPFSPTVGPGPASRNNVTYAHRSELDNSPQPDRNTPASYHLTLLDSSDGSDVATAWFSLLSREAVESTTAPVTIGDFTGELVTYADGPDSEYSWFELRFQLSDGVTEASISSEGVTVEELVALALTARRATPEEIQTMKDEFGERMAEVTSTTTGPSAPPAPPAPPAVDLPQTSGLPTTTMTFPAPTSTIVPATTSSNGELTGGDNRNNRTHGND